MSGPICDPDESPSPTLDEPETCEVQIVPAVAAAVGAVNVNRLVPRRSRRMVGAWCFVDHMLPAQLSEDVGLDVGPHPHIGLQTVTWLIEGTVLHRDSLGSEQLIRPGQLNLMAAGDGVSHSEETRGIYSGPLEGIQFWVAQPESTRHGSAAFEHHENLPQVDVGNASATVLVGSFGGASSPARNDSQVVGVQLAHRAGSTVLPLEPGFEYAVVVVNGGVRVCGSEVSSGELGYLGIGRDEVGIDADGEALVMLIGGEPFVDELVMWWNYVARSRDEITRAHRDWSTGSERFGVVHSSLERVDVADPPWIRG